MELLKIMKRGRINHGERRFRKTINEGRKIRHPADGQILERLALFTGFRVARLFHRCEQISSNTDQKGKEGQRIKANIMDKDKDAKRIS